MRQSIIVIIACLLSLAPAAGQIYRSNPPLPTSVKLLPPTTSVTPQSYASVDIEDNDKTTKAWCLNLAAIELTQCQRYEEAQVLFEEACKLDPNENSATIHINYAQMLSAWGKVDEAIEEYNKVLSFDPENEVAEINIASCFTLLPDIKQARFYFKKFIADHPDSPRISKIKAVLKGLHNAAPSSSTTDLSSPDYYNHLESWNRWAPMLIPVLVYIDSGDNIPGFKDSYTKMLKGSFDTWIQASNGCLAWQQVLKKEQADVVCTWTNDRREIKSSAAEQAHTYTQSKQIWWRFYITHASSTFCITHALNDSPLNDDEMNTICLHEVGHILGINGHSPNSHDVMFYSVQSTSPQALSDRDIATLRRLYSK